VAIIRLYIAWERSWVQYATTNQKNQKPKTKIKTNQKLWCRDLEHLDSIYTYIMSGNLILSGEEQGSCGAAGGALPPHRILVLHQIIYDYLTLYTYIYCQDVRDLDIIVFCFLLLFLVLVVGFIFFFCYIGLLLHIVLNFSLKLCTTWWWPPLWPRNVVISYLPPFSYIILIII